MATFNIYLRDKTTTSETPLTLYITDQYHILKVPTKKKIEPKYWNIKQQKVKSAYPYGNCEDFDDELKAFTKTAKEAYDFLIKEGEEISVEKINDKILSLRLKESSLGIEQKAKGFFECFEDFIKECTEIDGKKGRTIQAYTTTRDHLKVYSILKKATIKVDCIDISFIKKYKRYLLDEHIKNTKYNWEAGKIIFPKNEEKGLTDSAVSKDIKVIKTFCIWLNNTGIINNKHHRDFKVEEIDADIIVLDKDELKALARLEVPEHLQKYLDIFLVGSTVGLRISDLLNISPHKVYIDEEDLSNSYLSRKTYKTNKDVQLPLLPFVAKIFLKYQEKYPTALPTVTEQKLNKYLKEIGKLGGLTYLEERIRLKDGKQVKEVKEKYKFMSSHMCRRNFICLLAKAGETAETIMDLSGHSDYKSFKKYLKFFNVDRFKVIQRALGDLYDE